MAWGVPIINGSMLLSFVVVRDSDVCCDDTVRNLWLWWLAVMSLIVVSGNDDGDNSCADCDLW